MKIALIMLLVSLTTFAGKQSMNIDQTFAYMQNKLSLLRVDGLYEIKPKNGDKCTVQIIERFAYEGKKKDGEHAGTYTFNISNIGETSARKHSRDDFYVFDYECIEESYCMTSFYEGETEEEYSQLVGGFPTEKDATRFANAFNHLKELCDKSDPFN